MPYELKRTKGGYQVSSKDTGKVHSNKPMSKIKARKQMRALYANMPESEKK